MSEGRSTTFNVSKRSKARSEFVGAYVDPKTRAEVDRLAKRDDVSRSDVFRRLLRLGIESDRREARA